MEGQHLIEACERFWDHIRRGNGARGEIFHSEFDLSGFPGPDYKARFLRVLDEAPSGEESESVDPAPRVSSEAGMDYLVRFFGEGKGLTNLVHYNDGVQSFQGFGLVQLRWTAEYGLGEKGSPRYGSGRTTLSFVPDEGGAWKLRGWLGSRGPHHAVSASRRAEDVQAIREQILRVFEAYRQKDLAMLRRTHTADWRGFSLASTSVGRGIEAYIQAAEGAVHSAQFEEYQILDLDAVFYGDMAIVPYVARIAGRNRQGKTEAYRLRVLDVYLREPSGWNQVATSTSLHPEERIGS